MFKYLRARKDPRIIISGSREVEVPKTALKYYLGQKYPPTGPVGPQWMSSFSLAGISSPPGTGAAVLASSLPGTGAELEGVSAVPA